jgi:hypothetical protein
MPLPSIPPSARPLSYRPAALLATTLVGSFAFTWGFVALGVAGQVALGGDFEQAEMVMMLLAFLVFLPLFLWAFASRRQGRVTGLLFGGAGGMAVAAWALQRAVLT